LGDKRQQDNRRERRADAAHEQNQVGQGQEKPNDD
jgi:hypothetical protein